MYSRINYDIFIEKGEYIAKYKPWGIPDEETKIIKADSDFINSIEEIINTYKVNSWNGFSKSNSEVYDGDSFNLTITFDDNSIISADGYMMWPNNYNEFKESIDSLFENKFNVEK